MAVLKFYAPRIEIDATITLNRDELGALDALTGYGVDKLIAHFYKHMGESYLRPHEAGLKSFLKAAAQASSGLDAVRRIERTLKESAAAVRSAQEMKEPG
jgi:hypothetical protein